MKTGLRELRDELREVKEAMNTMGSRAALGRARDAWCRGRERNTKGYSSTCLATGFANVRAGTWYPPEH